MRVATNWEDVQSYAPPSSTDWLADDEDSGPVASAVARLAPSGPFETVSSGSAMGGSMAEAAKAGLTSAMAAASLANDSLATESIASDPSRKTIGPAGRETTSPSVTAPQNASAQSVTPAFVGETSVDLTWLAQRQTAIEALRAEYVAARAQAQVPLGTTAEIAFMQAFQQQAAARSDGPLQTLGRLYGETGGALLRDQPDFWKALIIQTQVESAGAAPVGQAMGDPKTLAGLDAILNNPLVVQLIDAYGATPAAPTGALAQEHVRLLGPKREAQLGRLINAMQAVRNDYIGNLRQALARGESIASFTVAYENGTAPGGATLASQFFARFYGAAKVNDDLTGPDVSFANGWSMNVRGAAIYLAGPYTPLDANHTADLFDPSQIAFDPLSGWVTAQANVKPEGPDFWDQFIPLVAIAVGTVFAAPVVAGVAGATSAAAAGAAYGGTSAFMSGAVHGDLNFKDVAFGTLGGWAGGEFLQGASGVEGVAKRAVLQGGLTAATGGDWKAGVIGGLTSGVANEVGLGIDKLTADSSLSPTESFLAEAGKRVVGASLGLVGHSGDFSAAFAGSLVDSGVRAVVANGSGDASTSNAEQEQAVARAQENFRQQELAAMNAADANEEASRERANASTTVATGSSPTDAQQRQVEDQLVRQGYSRSKARDIAADTAAWADRNGSHTVSVEATAGDTTGAARIVLPTQNIVGSPSTLYQDGIGSPLAKQSAKDGTIVRVYADGISTTNPQTGQTKFTPQDTSAAGPTLSAEDYDFAKQRIATLTEGYETDDWVHAIKARFDAMFNIEPTAVRTPGQETERDALQKMLATAVDAQVNPEKYNEKLRQLAVLQDGGVGATLGYGAAYAAGGGAAAKLATSTAGAAVSGITFAAGSAYAAKADLSALAYQGVQGKSESKGSTADAVANIGFDISNLQGKLQGYLLDPAHPQNQLKAVWFERALGFDKDNWQDLASQLMFDEATANQTKVGKFGTTYEQVLLIHGANGNSVNVTFVFMKGNDGVIRLVTGIPTKR